MSKPYSEWSDEKKQKVRDRAKLWTKNLRETNYARAVFLNVRRRSRLISAPFDLEESDIVIPSICPVLGLELKMGVDGRPEPHSPSVDRINPELGYTKGNIQVISNKANAMKNDATPEELRMFAKWVLKTFPEEPDAQT